MTRVARRAATAPSPAARAEDPLTGVRAVVLLVVAATFAFATHLGAPFFLDDSEAIERNPHIRSLTPISRALASPPQSAVSGRPLVSLSLAVNYAIGGLEPAGYHAWNLVVHAGVALLLWGVARRTLRRPPVPARLGAAADGLAFAIALLWVVHPLHSEVIAYVVQRTEAMMAFCLLLALYASVRFVERPDRRGWAALAIVAGVAGAGTKESIVTAPVLVLLWDAAFGAGSLREALRRRAWLYAGLLLSWAALAALHWETPRFRSAGFSTGLSPVEYLIAQAPLVLGYLKLALWPYPLIADYGPASRVSLAQAWLPLTIVTALVLGALLWWRRDPRLALLTTWIVVTLAPASSLVPIATEIGAERRMYVPLMGLAALVVLAAHTALERLPSPPWRRRAAPLLAATAWLALTSVSAARGVDYQDPARVWASVIAHRPHGRAYHNLGIVLAADGRTAEAEAMYRRAADTLPEARYSLGHALATRGELPAAATEFRAFLAERPEDAQAPLAANMLGMVLARQGDHAGAADAFRRTLAMRPGDADARRGLAEALTALGAGRLAQGRPREASEAFAAAVDAAPDAPGAHLNLATSLLQAGMAGEAENRLRKALLAHPEHAPLRNALAAVLARRGADDEASAEFARVLATDPLNAEARAGLTRLQRPARGRP